MNAILKFKQGKKIIKFLAGGGWAGFYTVGNVPRHVASKSPTRKKYLLNPNDIWEYKGNRVITRNGVHIVDPKYRMNLPISKQGDRRPTQSSSNQHKVEDKSIKDTSTKNKSAKSLTGGSNTNATNTNVGKGSKTLQSLYYTSRYKGKVPEKLSSREAVSNFLEKYLKDYYTPGTYDPDGIWGNNTQAAYDRYLATLALNVLPTAAPIVETPVVTPEVLVPEVEIPIAVQEYRPGIYNNEGYIPMAGSYTNVNGLYDYIINNPTSREAMLFNNAYGNFFNRELFDRIMNLYGISGHLGRRDTKRLNGLLDLLKQIGTDGSNERNDFIKTINNPAVLYNRNGGLLSKNPILRFKLKRGGKFFKY